MKKTNTKPTVIVIGAGLAGLSAALELQMRGYAVTLLEAKAQVGGRTSSWNENGMPVESGLHRVLGFYKEFPRLIRRAGLRMSEVVVWEDELEIRVADGPAGVYGASPVFRPVHSVASLFTNRLVSWRDTVRLTRFFAAGIAAYYTRPAWLDSMSVLDYARRFNISDTAITRVLSPLTAGIFFLPPERYSAFVLFSLLGQGARRLHRVRIGAFRGGMTEVLAGPIAAKIEQLGGTVLTEVKAERIVLKKGKAAGVQVGKRQFDADAVILATALGAAKEIISASNLGTELPMVLALPTMPEINIQLELSEPAWPVDRTVFGAGSPLITFAEQSRTTFKNARGRLSVILSPPEKFIAQKPEEIYALFEKEAPRLGIDPAKVIRYRVIAMPDDFYLLSPGTEKLRPATETNIKHLYLAGDFVKQPLLATMEGAIISGRKAAKAVMRNA